MTKPVEEEEVKEKKYKYRPPKKGSWYKKPRAKKVKPPAPVEPIKPERPRRAELRKIYRNVLTTDVGQQVSALAEAASWYDRCIVYVAYKQRERLAKKKTKRKTKLKWHQIANPWTLPQLRIKNALERARTSAITIAEERSKREKFILAIQNAEKLVAAFKPPLLRVVLRRYERDKTKLEARHKRLKNRFGEFLDLMEKVLRPKNPDGKRVSLRVDKIKDPFRIDIEGNVTFDRKEIAVYRKMSRKSGLLPVVMKMLPALENAAARIPELDPHGHKTGRMVTSQRKARMAGHEMLYNLIQYAVLDPKPKRLVRKARKPKAKASPSEE